MKKEYRSDACAAIHELASDIHSAGVMDKRVLRKFDDSCLVSVRPMKPEDIRNLRRWEHVSQSVFAMYLNVSRATISKWERGENRPDGASLKLLTLVRNKGLDAMV